MSREWQPGDVASVVHRGTQAAFRTTKGWTYIDGSANDTHADTYGFRPLVVIDPENREQVERFAKACPDDWCFEQDEETLRDVVDQLQDALREFANPTPPKPDEPTGLGAVVEDDQQRLYVNVGTAKLRWRHGSVAYDWREIAVVRVLSEGIS